MKLKVRDPVAIVQGRSDGVRPDMIGLQGRVTRVHPPTSKCISPHIEVTFVDGTKRVFYEDEIEKMPAV